MILGGLSLHTGGAAAGLGLWALLGALLPVREQYPYPRKRGIRPSRLFFSVSLALCINAALLMAFFRVFPAALSAPLPRLLGLWGAAGFSLPPGARALSLPLSRKAAYGLGVLFFALTVVVTCFL